jgi:hypothetical protein
MKLSVVKKMYLKEHKKYDIKQLTAMTFFQKVKTIVTTVLDLKLPMDIFDTFEDLSNADRPWQTEKTNEQLMTETKEQLFEELKKWKETIITNPGIDNTLLTFYHG